MIKRLRTIKPLSAYSFWLIRWFIPFIAYTTITLGVDHYLLPHASGSSWPQILWSLYGVVLLLHGIILTLRSPNFSKSTPESSYLDRAQHPHSQMPLASQLSTDYHGHQMATPLTNVHDMPSVHDMPRSFPESTATQETMAHLKESITDHAHTIANQQQMYHEISQSLTLPKNLMHQLSRPQSSATMPPSTMPPSTTDSASSYPISMDQVILQALYNQQLALYIQPTVSIIHKTVPWYETFVRIKQDQQVIEAKDFIKESEIIKQACLIDNQMLTLLVQALNTSPEDVRSLKFFFNLSYQTLNELVFLNDFMAYFARNSWLRKKIVFELHYEYFYPDDGHNKPEGLDEFVNRMGEIGYQFSMDNIDDLLQLNIGYWYSKSIRYYKSPASMMLQDLDGLVAALEIAQSCQARIIVTQVEDEESYHKLHTHGVTYMQGYYFQPPYPS